MAFSVHWLTLTCTRKPLCPLLSPVYAFTLFKAQRYLSILCSTCLSSTLLVSHPFTFLCFTPPTAPLPPSLHPSLSSHFTSSCQSPLLSPPLHPLMIAEHISSDTKTKGWVHMWFLCESRVIWNINVGIIWLSGKGGERGVGGLSNHQWLPLPSPKGWWGCQDGLRNSKDNKNRMLTVGGYGLFLSGCLMVMLAHCPGYWGSFTVSLFKIKVPCSAFFNHQWSWSN